MILLLSFAVLFAALVVAAVNDIADFKIPNWISLALAGAFLAAAAVSGAGGLWTASAAGVGALALAAGFILFALNTLGGGDAKFFAATALWAGPEAILPFALYTALAGGAIALGLLAFRKQPVLPFYTRVEWLMRLHDRKRDMPFGVAIAIGAAMAAPDMHLFQILTGQSSIGGFTLF